MTKIITKKILIPSAILLTLTIGGITMAARPTQPVKRDTQSTSTETTAPMIDMTPTGPVTSAAPIPVTTGADAGTPPTVTSSPAPPTDTAATPAPAPTPQPVQAQPQPPVDNSQPGNHSQSSQTFTVNPIN